MRPPRLFVLVTQLERGGAQKIALHLARHLSDQGHDVTLCFFYDRVGMAAELRVGGAFPVIDLGGGPSSKTMRGAWAALGAFWRLFWTMRRAKVGTLITFTHYSNLFGMPLAWLAGVPLRVASARSLLADRPHWFVRLHGLVLDSPATQRVIAVSEQVRRMCIDQGRVRPEKVQVIHNGLDVALYRRTTAERDGMRDRLGIPAGAQVLLTVARLEKQKGHAVLLQAAQLLSRKYPNLFYLWVGDGPEREVLAQAVSRAGLHNRIRLLGSRTDIPDLLAAADVFVLPSLAEGLPNAILEALAAALPVVATAAGGIVEIIDPGANGLLVPAGDAAALAAALGRLLDDRALRLRLSQRGPTHVDAHFSDRQMLARYDALLRELQADRRL